MAKRRRARSPGPAAEELLGSLESACMRALWSSAPASVGDVLERVNTGHDPELAYTTVMTVLTRLHEKGYVTRERHGRGYVYQPAYSEQELVDLLSRRDVDRLVERYGTVALAHFVEALERSDPDLLDRIRALQEDSGRG